jgi:hypothetical protein
VSAVGVFVLPYLLGFFFLPSSPSFLMSLPPSSQPPLASRSTPASGYSVVDLQYRSARAQLLELDDAVPHVSGPEEALTFATRFGVHWVRFLFSGGAPVLTFFLLFRRVSPTLRSPSGLMWPGTQRSAPSYPLPGMLSFVLRPGSGWPSLLLSSGICAMS